MEHFEKCRLKLEEREVEFSNWMTENKPLTAARVLRVLSFDPSEVYSMIDIDIYKRINSISINHFFPRIEGVCPCGCGEMVTDNRRVWATNQCSKFAWSVRNIICNAHQQPHYYIGHYYGTRNCNHCGDNCDTELDHIIPVKHGGGGCWLSNFEFLCKKCHRDKTNKDFQFGKYNPNTLNQLRIFDSSDKPH